tara:strand:+ start:6709 stop:7842 length:1134 start_codon:yes stop_codon:yes gene_type:complete
MDIKKYEKIDICILSTYGHCGLDWMTSLLDNHDEVLIMPSFSFFRCFYYIKTWNREFNFDDRNIENKKIANEFVRLFKKDKRQQNQRRKFLFSLKQFDIFEKTLERWLDTTEIKDKYKSLFLGIHYAFAKVHNIDLDKKKIIVSQEHVPFYCEKYLKIFDPKFIFIVRDPRASIAGSILRMQKHNNDKIYSNQFDHIIYTWKFTNLFVEKYKKKSKIFIAQNEKMHKNLKIEMLKLSKWLNIKFKSSLLKQTVLGKIWFGESSYLQGKNQEEDLKKYPPKNFYEQSEIKKRWKSQLTENDILFIELIFKDIFLLYKFSFLKKQSLKNKLFAYYYILTNFNYQKKYFISKIIIIPRNILRRLFILFSPRFVKFIYRFH